MSDIDNIFTKFQEIFKKAETLNDSASFSFIKANLPMLKNSPNAQHRFIANRLENKLKENENFQTFVSAQVQVKKEEVTKEERKEHYERYEMKSNQQAANNKVQEDKKKAAEAERIKSEDLAYYKRINDQAAYNARINQIFLELELDKQKEIIQVQEKFKPENQQAVRNFILDRTQTEPEATQNLANIINKEEATFDSNGNKFEPLKVSTSDSSLTVSVDPRTSVETMDNISGKANAVFDQALGVGNTEAAMAANSVATTVEATKAAKEATTSLEAAEKVLGKSVVDSENKDVQRANIIKKQVDEAYPKLQNRINKIQQDTTYSDEKKDQMIKEAQDKFSHEFAKQMKQQGYDMSNKETQNLVIDDLSSINYYKINSDLEDKEKTQAEKNLRDFAKVLKLDEKKVEQELTKAKEAAEQAIKDFNDVPIESQQATTQETQKFVVDALEALDAFETTKKAPKALKASETLEASKSEKEKNSNNVELAKDEHTGLVSSDSSNSLNEAKEQVQQQIENDKKATEAIFDKKKDVAEVYSEMKNNEENTKNGEIINNSMSNNAKETTEGRIDKSSLKNSVDESWAYGIAQEEAKRKDDSDLKTAEEINKISNSNETSSPK